MESYIGVSSTQPLPGLDKLCLEVSSGDMPRFELTGQSPQEIQPRLDECRETWCEDHEASSTSLGDTVVNKLGSTMVIGPARFSNAHPSLDEFDSQVAGRPLSGLADASSASSRLSHLVAVSRSLDQ